MASSLPGGREAVRRPVEVDRGDDLAAIAGDRRRDRAEPLRELLADPGVAVAADPPEALAQGARSVTVRSVNATRGCAR